MKLVITTTADPGARAFLITVLQAVAARLSAGETTGLIGAHTGYQARADGEPLIFLALPDIARRAGLTPETVKTYRKRALKNLQNGTPHAGDLPEPDAMTGNTPGWLPATIDAWRDRRPERTAAA